MPPLPTLFASLREYYPGAERRAEPLLRAFLTRPRYDRDFMLELARVARGSRGDPWAVRSLATLMMEHHLWRLAPGDLTEHAFLLGLLGLLPPGETRLPPRVLREGYTSRELPVFVGELRAHLGRLAWRHQPLLSQEPTLQAMEDFLAVLREPCKLVLARYLFSPADVADSIRGQMQLSAGLPNFLPAEGVREAQRFLATLPDYERTLIRELQEGGRIYWSGPKTSLGLNSVVESPIGTAACVIKAPGSSLELQIKRSGIRADFPITAAYSYPTGEPLPPTHRLQGGASTASLRNEAESAGRLAEIFRISHGTEAPLSKVLSLNTCQSVPLHGESIHLVDYFTDPEVFGHGYDSMRSQMQQCVDAFDAQDDAVPKLPGAFGLTGRFIAHVLPCQGLLARTSSHRLDTLAKYLAPGGLEAYFVQGLRGPWPARPAAKQFADTLLEEVLGRSCAPATGWEDHGSYLDAAFAVPENRARADRLHEETVTALGLLWGTLLAVGGYSHGESFVARNVGLKSVFLEGAWTVQLYSMDHDCLHVPDEDDVDFQPYEAWRFSVLDECYLCANPGRPGQIEGCSLWCLDQIYHMGPEARPRTMTQFHRSLERAYRQTRRTLGEDPRIACYLSPAYLGHLEEWDRTAAEYLKICDEEGALPAWQERTTAWLQSRHFRPAIIANYLKAIEKHDDVVRRYAFLFTAS